MGPVARLAANRVAAHARLAARALATTELETLRTRLDAGDATVTTDIVRAAVDARAAIDAEIDVLETTAAELRIEIARDEAMERLQNEPMPGGGAVPQARQHGDGVVQREARTYSAERDRTGQASFFSDFYRAYGKPGTSPDFRSLERLQRHDQEVRTENEAAAERAGMNREAQERATTTSSFAGLIPPQYLVDQAAILMRAGRPAANMCYGLPLPDEGMSFVIPRGTTGASAAIQATENSNVSSTDEAWANLTIPVATVAGQQDISRQSLERGTPGIDQIIYNDLAGAYGVALDQQVISGTGSSGQALGIIATSGINTATAFGALVTPATFYSKVAGQINAVQTTRFLPPSLILAHPRRWNWLLTQFDSQGRPLVVPEAVAMNPMGTLASLAAPPQTTANGNLISLPVVTDASMPTAVGTGPEDQVLVVRREDLLLWENGDGMPRQLQFEQTLGNQLTVKLVAYNYFAFSAGRYPTAVGLIGGNATTAGWGLFAPTF